MRRGWAAVAAAGLFLGLAGEAAGSAAGEQLSVESSAFTFGGDIPVQYSCDGENVSPPLEWSKPPKGTKEIVVTLNDADVPSPDGTFLHWSVWRLRPRTRELEEGSVPSVAREGENQAGQDGYFGPCPPGEAHRYIFSVYALSKKLGLDKGASAQEFREAMAENRDRLVANGFVSGCYPTGCQ
ncbi:MAG: YbhB/YbcL family Raf kinase inhibitor-like protein [Actinomycetota bacterium]